jgi:hypothetical protein
MQSYSSIFQGALSDPSMTCSIAYTGNNFGWFPEIRIKHLETQGLLLQEFMGTIKM